MSKAMMVEGMEEAGDLYHGRGKSGRGKKGKRGGKRKGRRKGRRG